MRFQEFKEVLRSFKEFQRYISILRSLREFPRILLEILNSFPQPEVLKSSLKLSMSFKEFQESPVTTVQYNIISGGQSS